ncbi:MAG: hypothetical protein WC423_13600 [Vulcanimicrobiota bacterium]
MTDHTGLRPITEIENRTISDALGLLSRIGGGKTDRFRGAAFHLSWLHEQGAIIIDPATFAPGSGEEATQAITDDPCANRKIRLNPSLFNDVVNRSYPENNDMMRVNAANRKKRDRLRAAALVAAILYHELEHWNNPPSAWEKNKSLLVASFEGPAYERERDFFSAILQVETDPDRHKLIYDMASGREAEQIQNGYLEGPRIFP